MDTVAYVLNGIGALLLTFPYVPFLRGSHSVYIVQEVEFSNASTFTQVSFCLGVIFVFIGGVAEAFGIEGSRDTLWHPLPLKTFATGVFFLLVSGVWRLATAMASLYRAGSRALPLQILGAMILIVGIIFGTISKIMSDCSC